MPGLLFEICKIHCMILCIHFPPILRDFEFTVTDIYVTRKVGIKQPGAGCIKK